MTPPSVSGGSDSRFYEEETTVSGKGYTRYVLNSFSNSSLPGATSDFWEFRAADERSRKRYAAAYRKSKSRSTLARISRQARPDLLRRFRSVTFRSR